MADSKPRGRAFLEEASELNAIYCEPCKKGGHLKAAEGYCVTCQEYLCKQCYKAHKRFKASENHVLQDNESMLIAHESDYTVLVKDSKTVAHDEDYTKLDICAEKCTTHKSIVIEYFCETCDKLACHVCVKHHHPQCKNIKHIHDIVSDFENSKELNKFHKDLNSTAGKLSTHKERIELDFSLNNEMRTKAKQDIRDQRSEINKFFDQLELKIDQEADAIQQKNEETLKTASSGLDQLEDQFDEIQKYIETKEKAHTCELFIALKKGKQRLKNFDDQFNELFAKRIQRYTILPSEQVNAMIRTTAEICRIATARLECKLDIRTSIDKTTPFIRSLTMVQGHYCAIVDNANTCVKLLDTKRKCVTSHKEIGAEILWAIATLPDDHLALSVSVLQDKDQIQFFSVSDSGEIQNRQQNDIDNCYFDFVYCNGNMYAFKHYRIHVLDINGKVIRTIQKDGKGNNLFGNLQGIAGSPDGETIYVTDDKKHKVISLTLDGEVKTAYEDKNMNPHGIAVDKDGFVYVFSTGTRNIYQFTADLNKVQILLDDVMGPYITYSSVENKLFISSGSCISQYCLTDSEDLT